MTTASTRKWYRQLWPWLVMIPPAGAVAGGIVTLIIAFSHVENDMRANPTEFLGVPHEVAVSPAHTSDRSSSDAE